MPTSTSNVFGRVSRRRPCRICGKTDWCSFYVEFQPFFSQSFFRPPLNLRTIGRKHRSAFFSFLFIGGSHNTDNPPVENKKERGAGAWTGASATQRDGARRRRISGSESRGEDDYQSTDNTASLFDHLN